MVLITINIISENLSLQRKSEMSRIITSRAARAETYHVYSILSQLLEDYSKQRLLMLPYKKNKSIRAYINKTAYRRELIQ